MNLKKATGVIGRLCVVHTRKSVLFGPQMQEASRVSAIVFASAGMSGAAVQTSMNSEGGTDDVDMYSFEIEGVTYAGRTRGISLRNGDEVEFIYESRLQGNEVLAVRRPMTRSIWLHPYMSRGSRAALRHGLKIWLLSSAGMAVLFWLCGAIAFFLDDFQGSDLVLAGAASLIGMLLATAMGASWILPRLFRFAQAADEIFATLGYESPRTVDLQKTSKAHRKANNIPWTWDNKADLWY